MKNRWLVFAAAVAGTCAAPAAAQLRIFFATTGASAPAPLPTSPALENPQIETGQTLYLYAQMSSGPEAWNGISLDVEVRGGGIIVGQQFYNYANGYFLRWDYADSGTLENDDTLLVNAFGVAFLAGFGVQNSPLYDPVDLHYRRDVDATLLGWIVVALPGEVSEAEVFLGIGRLGITKAGTPVPQDIYLGFGDEEDGLTGNSIGQFSSLADATVTKDCAEMTRGDANCDGAIDSFDIDPFILALTDPAGYEAQFPDCTALCTCDIDQDGRITSFDIDPFVECLNSGCP